ncbi:hypothetical protein BH09MYX1_BH09MYX1_30310 [soil metagenome]
MRLTSASFVALAGAVLFGAGWACLHREATAESPVNVTDATALVLATAHDDGATSTDVRRVVIRADGVRTTTLGTIAHPPGAVVRGDSRGARIAVVADDALAADRGEHDWGSLLYQIGTAGPHAVASGVGHAGRPLVSEDGLVYVERGTRGPVPTDEAAREGHLREDAISITAVDDDGNLRNVYSANGYALHLCGEDGAELVVYRVRFGGAALLAIDRANGKSRVITEVAPFARDFTVDRARHALVFSNRDSVDEHRWILARVDLESGSTTELQAEVDSAPAPFALERGGFAFSAAARGGLTFDGAAPVAPTGAGFGAVQAESRGGAWLLVAHVGSGYDETIALHRATTRVIRLTTRDERIDAIGFDGEGSVVR